MKKILLACSFLILTLHCFGQQFSQYNTGTLYDSFENLSQRSFIPDSSRQYASNFLLPNFSTSTYLTGNAQAPLKSRAFLGRFKTTNLELGTGRYNRVNSNLNYYSFMFKAFTSLEGYTEIGISLQTRAELRGLFSDESVALYNGLSALRANHYDDVFNNHATYQLYHQLGFSYREKINKQFAIGAKLSLLMGIRYQKIDIEESHLDINRPDDLAVLALRGKYKLNYVPGGFSGNDLLPSLRNPGAAISIGSSVHTRDNFNLQFNLKDLGFIHWSNRSYTYYSNGSDTIKQISTIARERNIYYAAKNAAKTNLTTGSFTTATNAKFEISANKAFWLDNDNQYRYSPTLILSKELFFPGFVAALVSPVTHKNLSVTMTTTYGNDRIFSFGGQFMVKSANAEFFIGTEKLFPTGRAILSSMGSRSQINYSSSYAGADVFLGVSFKFGRMIEHPLNASFIPLEDKPGFIKRLYGKLFKKDTGY